MAQPTNEFSPWGNIVNVANIGPDGERYGIAHSGGTVKAINYVMGTDGTIYALKMVDGKPRYSSMPYLYDIAEGNIPGHSMWEKTGYNPDVDSGTEDLWWGGGTYTWPAAEQQMELVSTSVEDDPVKADASVGTGIHTVTVHYLNAAGVEKSEDVNLNGTGVVTTTATDIFRIQNFRTKATGTALKAIGTISIRNLADTPVYSQIGVGLTRARNSAWRVPAGKTLYITSVFMSSTGTATGKDAIFTIRSTYDNKALAIRPFMMPIIEAGVMDGGVHRDFELPIKLPAGVDILGTVTVGNDNTTCICVLRGWTE